MHQVDPNLTRRQARQRGLWASLAIAAATGASAVTIALPATAGADPEPAPPPTPTSSTPSPQPGAPASPTSASPSPSPQPGAPASPTPASPTPNAQPGDPNAVPPADPNAPAPDPNAVEPGRINNAVGGFSFAIPAGWVESDASHLDYGSALLSKAAGEAPMPGQAQSVANDTRIVLGRLDQKLYASAEATNPKAAVRLGSDMGEFFMPYPGTRVNQETVPLNGNGLTGSASYYEVKFSDATKPNGQIWTGVVGTAPAAPTTGTTPAPTTGPPQRWFVVWLGTSNNPVDKNAAKALAESIRPFTPPPAGAEPSPGAPVPAPVVPAPVVPAVPGQAPAGEVAPSPSPIPQRSQPA